MDKKYTNIINSNLKNVTKAVHVPKRDMCSSVSLLQNSEMFKTRHAVKVCICFNTVKCSKMK